jgi:hypothetical protein
MDAFDSDRCDPNEDNKETKSDDGTITYRCTVDDSLEGVGTRYHLCNDACRGNKYLCGVKFDKAKSDDPTCDCKSPPDPIQLSSVPKTMTEFCKAAAEAAKGVDGHNTRADPEELDFFMQAGSDSSWFCWDKLTANKVPHDTVKAEVAKVGSAASYATKWSNEGYENNGLLKCQTSGGSDEYVGIAHSCCEWEAKIADTPLTWFNTGKHSVKREDTGTLTVSEAKGPFTNAYWLQAVCCNTPKDETVAPKCNAADGVTYTQETMCKNVFEKNAAGSETAKFTFNGEEQTCGDLVTYINTLYYKSMQDDMFFSTAYSAPSGENIYDEISKTCCSGSGSNLKSSGKMTVANIGLGIALASASVIALHV